MMTGPLDHLEAGVRHGPGQAAGGGDGNHGVVRVGQDEHGNTDRRESGHQAVQLAQQGPLLGQECAP
jgi:hypothetical protein